MIDSTPGVQPAELLEASWWHGGAPGLQPGQLLLPRAQLAAWSGAAARGWAGRPQPRPGAADPETTVSITTDPWAALAYADDYREPWPALRKLLRVPGTLYRVAPVQIVDHTRDPQASVPHRGAQACGQARPADAAQAIEPTPWAALLVDPDFPDHPASFARVSQAVVLEVVREHVELSERDFVRHLAAYQSWADGDPVYTDDGRLRPSPSMRAARCTIDSLADHGAWVPLSKVHHFGAPIGCSQGWTSADERARTNRPRRDSLQLAGGPLGRFAVPFDAASSIGLSTPSSTASGGMPGASTGDGLALTRDGASAPTPGRGRRRWLRRR